MKWMLCKLSSEVCRLETRIKIVIIPLSIMISASFLVYTGGLAAFIIAILEATLGVFIIWYADRQIILHLKGKYGNNHYARRIVLQVILTALVSSVIISIMFFSHMKIFSFHKEPLISALYLKGLIVNLMFFNLMVNGIYEILFMVENLADEREAKEKYKKAVVETRLENLRNQINPHFLFNTFTALSELIEEDPKRASNSIIELSDLYRYVLNSRDRNWETLEKELQITASFIEIIKIRYEEKVNIDMHIDEEYNSWYIPPMAVQLLIENAIKHNEISSTNRLNITIKTGTRELIVMNNLQPRKIMEESNGMGLQNIRERYNFLLGKEVSIEKTDSVFKVILPLIQKIEE